MMPRNLSARKSARPSSSPYSGSSRQPGNSVFPSHTTPRVSSATPQQPSRGSPSAAHRVTTPSQPLDSTTAASVSLTDISLAISAAIQPLSDRLRLLEDSSKHDAADQDADTSPTSGTSLSASLSDSLSNVANPSQSNDIKIWSGVPQQHINKIVTGQYVVLHLLLPARPTEGTQPSQVLTLEDGSPGQLSLTAQPRTSRRVSDMNSWLEAWTIFASFYAHAHPSRAVELLNRQSQSEISLLGCSRV